MEFSFYDLLLSIYWIMKYYISILIFFIGDYSIYTFINSILFNNKLEKDYITLKHWFFGNIISYLILSLLYWENIGNTYYDINTSFLGLNPYFYLFLTIPVNLLLMDTFFYFLHRIAHISILYNNIHNYHHKYRPITSWISRVSHWIDSNIENIAFTMPFVLIPTYFPLMWVLLMFTFYWGCLIHDNKLDLNNKYINCPISHGIHHKYGKDNYNFSYYFTHWDRICGTYKKKKIN